MSSMLKSQGVVVVGGQWGDEGKGRIVDILANDCDVVVRFQGGNNAGHSLHIGDISLALHVIPCGIVRADKICVIGNGVVIDPKILFQEMALLLQNGIFCKPANLKIAKNAHVIFPFHQAIDAQREASMRTYIGTTRRGIGPCYEDKIARLGIMTKDLVVGDVLKTKLEAIMDARHGDDFKNISFDQLYDDYRAFGDKLAPFLCDTGELLEDFFKKNYRILFEGAQGALLDIDHGTYPHVTSSNCVAAQASVGCGIGAKWLNEIFMVSKAYCTRVGEGPFFTEADVSEQENFRNLGNEYGATTGRARRCGWLDLPALKYAARINGATGLILTKLDVLAHLKKIKIATSYSYKDKKKLSFTDAMDLHAKNEEIDVEYEEFCHVEPMPTEITRLSQLPKTFRELCEMIERHVEIPIKMISYGKKRGQEFYLTM